MVAYASSCRLWASSQESNHPTIQALFELRCDTPEVLNLGEEDLAGEIKGPKRGLRNIYANKIPTLVDLELAPDLQAAVGLPMAEIVRLATLVSAVRSPPVLGKLSAALFFSNFQVGGLGQ
jgi:hypothetical protein